MTDNTTAVAGINNQGTSHCDKTNDLAFDVWQFCIKYDPNLTAAYIQGILNKVSDNESRNFKSPDKERMLNPKLLTTAIEILNFTPEIDLFASRLNKQFPQYCVYRPDPDGKFIDAFSISWSYITFYCFLPFNCILRAVRKIIQDQALGILVIHYWQTQPWYPMLMPLLMQPPVILHPSTDFLRLKSSPEIVHPLHKKLELDICLVSGKNLHNKACPKMQ